MNTQLPLSVRVVVLLFGALMLAFSTASTFVDTRTFCLLGFFICLLSLTAGTYGLVSESFRSLREESTPFYASCVVMVLSGIGGVLVAILGLYLLSGTP